MRIKSTLILLIMPVTVSILVSNVLIPSDTVDNNNLNSHHYTDFYMNDKSAPFSKEDNYEKIYRSISARVKKENIRKYVYYLAEDPLPRRVLNYSLPGHELSTLEEADLWIEQQLKGWGYTPERDETLVRAFGRDRSKPLPKQYAPPAADAPYYKAHNIFAGKTGLAHPEKVIVLIAHKDSQSWIASPGATDNAIGTGAVLELARILQNYKPNYSIRFIFCNEEHTPWTSITAAQAFKKSGLDVLALINMDGIGGKSDELAGQNTNVTRFTTPEGERLADLFSTVNERFNLGIEQSKFQNESPGDDDGSFIKAGFPWSVANKGSIPNADPNYHSETDTPDKVYYENAKLVIQQTVAVILYLDIYGRP